MISDTKTKQHFYSISEFIFRLLCNTPENTTRASNFSLSGEW